MLLTLRVQSRSGQPLGQALSAEFSAAGGRIGRSRECDLVLDDPGQIISRTHASIVFRDGHFYLADMGSNASMINERVLGIGKEEALSDGDRIRIGDYVLEASIENESTESDGTTSWLPPSPSVFGTFPQEDETETKRPESASALNDELSEANILKDADWPEGSNIFGLDIAGPGPTKESPAAEPDDVPPEKIAYVEGPERPVADHAGQRKKRSGQAREETAAHGFGVTEMFGPPVSNRSAGPADGAGKPPPVQARAKQKPGAGSGLPPVDQPAAVSDSEVLRALLRGMGLPELQLKKSAVEAAEQIGAMLREATSGTMSALLARTLTKQGSRIGVTVIAARENNPLKFFPDADAALALMLNNTAPGYVKPVQAYADAFSDLRAHEIAVIAGMQSALSSVLARFDPVTIEHGMTDAGLLDKLLPTHRKARLWDRMVELYREVSSEADHDFQRLFGERFAEAYEEQVRALRKAKKDCP